MKADGTIWIDTKIDASGMEEGFNRMRDGANDVVVSAKKAGNAIEQSFSKINVNKAIQNAEAQIESLKAKFDSLSAEYADAIRMDDDKAAAKLGAQREAVYDRLERARKKLAVEVAAAAEKEAAAEEKASQRTIAAAEKEAAAKKQKLSSQFDGVGKAAEQFGTRLRGIVASAFVFNVISSGLLSITSYFGTAAMANQQFAAAVYRLRGSLMVAFQPIYESVLPALITLINWLNVAVQAVARFFAILAGKSYSQMQNNASSLNSAIGNIGNSSSNASDKVDNMGDSIQDTGKKAKEAEKYLAGFDEINRMIAENADDLSDSLGNLDDIGGAGMDFGDLGLDDFTGPIFEEIELPKEWETAIDKLALRFKDIFFEWDNLNAEIVAEKLLTALTTLAGTLIGFALGGPGGALIGMIVGAGLGVVLSSLIFDGDGKLSREELIKSLVIALGIIGGGIIGFVAGGTIGSAAIGVIVGAGLSLVIASLIFDENGDVSVDGVTEALLITLGAIGGALIGFQLGGPGGALIGLIVGAGITFVLESMTFNNDGQLTYEELEKGLINVILPLGGAGIGVLVGGGPVGAIIGFAIGSFLSFVLQKADITAEEGVISGEALLSDIVDIFATFAITGLTMVLGGIAGGPPGAAMGAIIGLVASFRLLGIEFGEIQLGFDGLKKKIAEWSSQTTKTVESEFIKPTSNNMKNLQKEMTADIEQTQTNIQDNMKLAARGVENDFFTPTSKQTVLLSETMQTQNAKAAGKIVSNMSDAAKHIDTGFVNPVTKSIDNMGYNIERRMSATNTNIQSIFSTLGNWFSKNVTTPVSDAFISLQNRIVSGLNELGRAISNMLSNFYSTRSIIKSYSSSSSSTSYTTAYASAPAVPQLAKGAVIPPNNKFLAVLGDQRHGTNIEAPLATIQEAVAIVMDDVVQSNVVGYEAIVSVLQEILETILGIEIGDQVIADAVQRHQAKMAVVRGG